MAGPYNIPDVPGVPLINFVPGAEAGIELLSADELILFPAASGPQWGIFLDGSPVVVADSVVDFTYKQEWALSDYPIEQGAFGTYDKVQIPFDCRIRFSSGGSAANRQALLDSIAAIAGDTNLYDAVTPEEVYPSCNITHYDYKRSSRNGVGLIVVDVWLLQIRIVGAATPSNTQQPSGAATVNDGTVQPTAPMPTQQSSVMEMTPAQAAEMAGK